MATRELTGFAIDTGDGDRRPVSRDEWLTSLARMTHLYPGKIVAADDEARELVERVKDEPETRRLLALHKPNQQVTLPAAGRAMPPAPSRSAGARPRERRARSRSRSGAARGDPDSEPEPDRRCAVCGASLAGRRRHAVTCKGRCRTRLCRSRKRLTDADRVALERRYEAALALLARPKSHEHYVPPE